MRNMKSLLYMHLLPPSILYLKFICSFFLCVLLNYEARCPYKGVDGTCNANEVANHAPTITGYEDVPANNEQALQKAVVNQPVSVAIDASGSDFQFYQSDVFTGSCDTQLDHGVTAVGYGVSAEGTNYWLVKNSCGTTWGEEGYLRMQKDVAANEGLCEALQLITHYS
ncbi:hypothetical protein RIF29_33755 [Crotalaria pallida]|uniref:Peptidase C1A papain C-terminal domain-containing protein n=1 Tax=Crotalaria pallida TaxID=3830 RepID=A0AAN9E9C8_CROPI